MGAGPVECCVFDCSKNLKWLTWDLVSLSFSAFDYINGVWFDHLLKQSICICFAE